MTLDARVQLHLGALDLDVAFSAADGETVAVLGPNGAGKTTLLRALAGLVPLDSGHVVIDGETVDDPPPTSVRRPGAPVGRRRVPGLPPVPAPHRARERRVRAAQPRHTARGPRRRARLAGTRRPRRSGGASRASCRAASAARRARPALGAEPRLLLLDEPLAALDVGTRTELRRDLRTHLASFPGARVLVTHELLDAVALADRLVVLEHGRVAQEGSVADVSDRPRSRYVADLVGINLLHGRADATQVALDGRIVVTAEQRRATCTSRHHPHAVSLHRRIPREA